MDHFAAIRKSIIWFFAILFALIPIVLAVTQNLKNPAGIFSIIEYNKYYSELLFFTISISFVAMFELFELQGKITKRERVLSVIVVIATGLIGLGALVGAVSFGSIATIKQASIEQLHTGSISQTGCYYFLFTMIMIGGCVKYLHSAKKV